MTVETQYIFIPMILSDILGNTAFYDEEDAKKELRDAETKGGIDASDLWVTKLIIKLK